MLPHTYATGGGFPDVIQLLLDTDMDLALTTYGKCSVQADQSAQSWPAGPPCEVHFSELGFNLKLTFLKKLAR